VSRTTTTTARRGAQQGSAAASTRRQDGLRQHELSDPLVENASSDAERKQGLKGRRDLRDGDGMLFQSDREKKQGFHMEDTPADLDIAFADQKGVVTSTDRMEANTGQARGQGKYVLEQAAGSFDKQGIEKGSQLGDVPGVDLKK